MLRIRIRITVFYIEFKTISTSQKLVFDDIGRYMLYCMVLLCSIFSVIALITLQLLLVGEQCKQLPTHPNWKFMYFRMVST